MKLFALLSTLASLSLALPTTSRAYEGQQIVRVPFNDRTFAAARSLHLDILGKASYGLDLRVESPAQLNQLLTQSSVNKEAVTVLDADLQATVDAERKRLAQRDQQEAGPVKKTPLERLASYFDDYHKYEDVKQFCKDLATAYPNLVTFVPSIGKSVEGRDLFQIKITGAGDASSRPRIQLNSIQHAREWIGGATTQYIANFLLSNYAKDDRVTKAVNGIEWIITPVVNPDGYAYTWTSGGRMWRKNRRTENGRVVGVDTNRNWPFQFGRDDGSSSDPSDEDYRGPSPASEPEVQAMIQAFKAIPNLAATIDFHSYQESILRPWGWGEELTPDEPKFVELANKMMASVKATTKRNSNYNSLTKLYPVSGSIRDYMYSNGATPNVANKVYSYTVELSPNGRSGGNGFILPPSEIVKVGDEWAKTILVFAEHVVANRLGPKTA